MRMSIDAYSQTWASVQEGLPGLPARLAGCSVPTVFVHGGSSPMPVTASSDTAAAIGDSARVVVVPGAGHFIWHEVPGAVRAALDDLLAR
jgi:pimeloyl-ACP methyl ester carboxylesterase